MRNRERWFLTLVLLLGGLYFALLMRAMTVDVARMAGSVAAMQQDVARMNGSLTTLAADMSTMTRTIGSMHTSMQRMDESIQQGSDQIRQWNPMDMMNQTLPRGGAPRR